MAEGEKGGGTEEVWGSECAAESSRRDGEPEIVSEVILLLLLLTTPQEKKWVRYNHENSWYFTIGHVLTTVVSQEALDMTNSSLGRKRGNTSCRLSQLTNPINQSR